MYSVHRPHLEADAGRSEHANVPEPAASASRRRHGATTAALDDARALSDRVSTRWPCRARAAEHATVSSALSMPSSRCWPTLQTARFREVIERTVATLSPLGRETAATDRWVPVTRSIKRGRLLGQVQALRVTRRQPTGNLPETSWRPSTLDQRTRSFGPHSPPETELVGRSLWGATRGSRRTRRPAG